MFRRAACCGLLLALNMSASARSYVFGAPGSLEGRFETAAGEVDAQGWVQLYCDADDFYWQVDSFNAANLNDHGAGNNALWCGQSALQQPDWNNAPGYGNNWWAIAEWKHAVTDPGSSVDVTLQFYYNYETESGYDHFLVEWFDGEQWHNLLVASGTNRSGGVFAAPGLRFDQSWTMQPADYSGPDDDEVRLRLVVQSDGGVSDQDSLPFPGGETDGAAQVDDIRVLFDGIEVDNGGDADGVATFESGDNEGWTAIGAPCTCQLLARLPAEFEPGETNTTPVIGHLQDQAVKTTAFCTFLSPTYDFTAPGSPAEATLQFDAFFDTDARPGFSDYDVQTSWYVDGAWQPVQTIFTGDVAAGSWQTVQIDLTGLAPPQATQSYIAIQLYAADGKFHAVAFDNFMVWRGNDGTGSDQAPHVSGPVRAYPNPANPRTNVAFDVETAGRTRLVVYDQKGRLVRELLDEPLSSGSHQVLFDGRDAGGRPLASGVYFLQLTTPSKVRGSRFTLVK